MIKRLVRGIIKNAFVLWLLFIVAVSIYSTSITPRRSHILIIPQNNNADYNILFKTYTGDYSLSSAGTYITDVYVDFKTEKKNFKLEVEGKTYTSENNLVYDSAQAKKAHTLLAYIKSSGNNFYRVTNLPVKAFFKFSKRYPFFKSIQVINYSYWEIFGSIFSPLVIFTLIAFFARKKFLPLCIRLQHKIDFNRQKKTPLVQSFFNYGLLGVIIISIFLFIERQYPYYFLQDDSFAQFFPYLCRGMEVFYKEGSIPLYNFLQLNGTPDFGYSTYSYLNPVLHFSYGLALLIGNKFLLLDIFALLNLLLSAWLINAALIRLGIRQSLRVAASINITFSGFILIAGCSWYYLLPYLLFASLIFLIIVNIRKASFSFNNKAAVYNGVLFGVFIYFGNIQYWVYCMFLFLLLFFLVSFSFHRSHLKKAVFFAIKVLLLSLVMGAPLVILGIIETAHTSRVFNAGFSIYPYLWSLFAGLSNGASLPEQWGTVSSQKYHAHFYHIGLIGSLGIAVSVIIFGILLLQLRKRQINFDSVKKDQVWICGLIAINLLFLILAIGKPAVIYELQQYMPLLNKFQLAFKYLLLVVFLSNIIGACFLNTFIFSGFLKVQHAYIDVAIYALSGLFVFFHVQGINYAFFSYSHLQKNVYDDSWLVNDSENIYLNKYISFSHSNRSEKSYYTNSLKNNFATVFNLFSVNGYEPLNSKFPLQDSFLHKIDTLRKMGVNRIIVWKEPVEANTQYDILFNYPDSIGFNENESLIFSNSRVSIYKISGSDPLLFYYQNNQAIKDLQLTRQVGGSSLTFNLSKPIISDSIVVNFDYNKRLSAYINDKKIDKKDIAKDSYNRIVINTVNIKNIETVKMEYSYFD